MVGFATPIKNLLGTEVGGTLPLRVRIHQNNINLYITYIFMHSVSVRFNRCYCKWNLTSSLDVKKNHTW